MIKLSMLDQLIILLRVVNMFLQTVLLLTPFLTFGGYAAVTKPNPSGKQLEKREEVDGIYRIQVPGEQTVLSLGADVTGNPPLRVVVTKPLAEGTAGQEWSMVTTGSPVSRVVPIFNQQDSDNVVTNEFGFPGSKFTRAWHILDAGSGLVVLRNLGLCLTRSPGGAVVERSECQNGQDASEAQKWELIFLRKVPANVASS